MPEFELTEEQMKIVKNEIAAAHNETGEYGAVFGQVYAQYDGGQLYCDVRYFGNEHAKRVKAEIKKRG